MRVEDDMVWFRLGEDAILNRSRFESMPFANGGTPAMHTLYRGYRCPPAVPTKSRPIVQPRDPSAQIAQTRSTIGDPRSGLR